MPKFPHL